MHQQILHYATKSRGQLTLPQKVQVYRACWVISIWCHSFVKLAFSRASARRQAMRILRRTFLTCLRREAP
jgi:hypothetical protein